MNGAGAAAAAILVIDDFAPNRLFVEAALKKEGYRVLQAESGPAGLEAVRRENPDLVILDLMMPGMDGDEVARRLRAGSGSRRPAILLVTALEPSQAKAKAAALGVDAVLSKPVLPKVLREQVRSLLAPRP